jgi:arylsulfatase
MLRGESDVTHAPDEAIGWELFGKTAIRQGDWKITQEPDDTFWTTRDPVAEAYPWKLFNLAEDPSELNDVSDQYPEKLQEMIRLWDDYEERNGVIIPNQVMGY